MKPSKLMTPAHPHPETRVVAELVQFKGENMKTRSFVSAILVFVLAAMLSAGPAAAQQTTGTPGSPGRHHHDQRQAASAAGSAVWRRNQGRCLAVEILVGAAHRASQRRAQHPADYHG